MMAGGWLAVALALGAIPAGAEVREASTSLSAHERSGLLGWGVGLELPMVGVATGIGTSSRQGIGYGLGAGLGWEVTPRWLVRLYAAGGRAYGARAAVTFDGTGGRVQARANADWVGIDAGLGVAYLWRAGAIVQPYAGVDGGARFAGYSYHLTSDLQDRIGDPQVKSTLGPVCTVERRCSNDIYDGMALGWSAGLRAGVRVPMLRWLASQLEWSLAYTPVAQEAVSNTRTRLRVRSATESLWLARMTYSVRLGL
jgi:hypothetical protein